jgi:endogenous inhibitor of DNA gyrase (YacG/DUF329 family)
MKCTMAAYRADSKNRRHTVVCAECGQTVKVFHQTAIFCGLRCQRANAGKLGNQANIVKCEEKGRQCARPDCYENFKFGETGLKRYCSPLCSEIVVARAKEKSDIRQAVEDGDHQGVIDAVRKRVTISGGLNCWFWNGKLRDGYAFVKFGKKNVAVHRLVLEAKHGKSLGSQAAHHACGNSGCVRPEHLQPVTHAENTAEMLARHSHLKFQEEALAIIAGFDPNHEFLNRIELR